MWNPGGTRGGAAPLSPRWRSKAILVAYRFAVEPLECRRLFAAVAGVIFNDLNGDGVRQSTEAGVVGRQVYVDLNNNGQRDAAEPAAVTTTGGKYQITGLAAGKYTVRQLLPAGVEQTSPAGANATVGTQSVSGSFYAGQSAGGGLKIKVNAGFDLAANKTAMATVRAAVAAWEKVFADNVTVSIDLELYPLGQDGLLGATTLSEVTVPYDQVRDAMVAQAFPDEAIAKLLPSAASVKFQTPIDTKNPWQFSGNIQAPRAELKALGFPDAWLPGPASAYGDSTIDGDIYLNSDSGFDYNPADGIAKGKVDFYSTVLHEIGHVLGFDSGIDYADFGQGDPTVSHTVVPSPMDLFRVKPGVGAAGTFATATRVWTTGKDVPVQVFYDGGQYDPTGVQVPGLKKGDIPFSTGGTNGDGNQASHWKDDRIGKKFVGIMDPTLDQALTVPQPTDIRALGLLGWDVRKPLAGRAVTLASASATATGQDFGTRATDSDDQLWEAVPATAGQTLGGKAISTPGDVDVYAVRGIGGQRFGIDVDGIGSLDAELRVYDASGKQVAYNDNAAAPGEVAGKSPYLLFTFPRSGTYYVAVSGKGNGTFDVVTGTGPAVGSTGNYALNVVDRTVDDDNRLANATPLTVGKPVSSWILPGTDVDLYQVTVTKAGRRLGFDIDLPATPGAVGDSLLRLFDANGKELARNDVGAAPGEAWANESYLAYTFAKPGVYYVGVSAAANGRYSPVTGLGAVNGGPGGPYTLTASQLA